MLLLFSCGSLTVGLLFVKAEHYKIAFVLVHYKWGRGDSNQDVSMGTY